MSAKGDEVAQRIVGKVFSGRRKDNVEAHLSRDELYAFVAAAYEVGADAGALHERKLVVGWLENHPIPGGSANANRIAALVRSGEHLPVGSQAPDAKPDEGLVAALRALLDKAPKDARVALVLKGHGKLPVTGGEVTPEGVVLTPSTSRLDVLLGPPRKDPMRCDCGGRATFPNGSCLDCIEVEQAAVNAATDATERQQAQRRNTT